ncbi:hypothetical protein [Acidobacterium sp. S8]|uniref:hypothetical protein n=1 Tax=Acidobacterium sp. S8 TaxID=1641854 RepID=UPI00131ECB18|nr:hypothetical protein [Acidobacterium sp. S8]
MKNVYLLLAMALLYGSNGIGQTDNLNLQARYGEPTLERFTATLKVEGYNLER